MNSLNRFADPIYCIFRLVIGLLFACHGGQKILSFPPGGHGMPTDTLSWIGATIELVGGFLIAFGFLTRLAAFIAAGEMAVAYFGFHFATAPNAVTKFFPILNQGELALIYCWLFLFIFCYGAGRWSLDAVFRSTVRT